MNSPTPEISEPIADPLTEPKEGKVEEELAAEAKAATEVERQVIVHARVGIGNEIMGVRIWASTYLIPFEGGAKSKLLNTENIMVFPQWMTVGYKPWHHFTLIFEGLPRDCRQFDLIEEIPESGGFEARSIQRNATDIYQITF